MKVCVTALAVVGLLLLTGCGADPEPGSPPDQQQQEHPAQLEDKPATSSAPVLPDLSGPAAKRLRREVVRADREEMNPDVFAKVGDSNTEWPQNLYGLGCREVGYGSNGDLEPVVRQFTRVKFPGLEPMPGCSPVNPLSRRSAAAVSGVWTEWLMTPTAELPSTGIAPPTEECEPAQTPLDCEIELLQPRWVLIMSGTNDALLGLPLGDAYRNLMEQMVDRVRELGPVPVLSTLPPMAVPAHNGEPGEQRVGEANRIIEEVAGEKQVPLINLHPALAAEDMVDEGLAADGLHLGTYGGDAQPDIMRGSAVLTLPALKYGANRRNLIWLQTLEKLDESVKQR